MKHYDLTTYQRLYLKNFYETIHSYYVRGNPSYTTLMGERMNLQDVLKFLSHLPIRGSYDEEDRVYLNNIRSMYISLTND